MGVEIIRYMAKSKSVCGRPTANRTRTAGSSVKFRRLFLTAEAEGKPAPEGMIRWYIWQIENQHPPIKLLEHIRGGERLAADSRVWAVERALDHGIDQGKIRDAILEHAKAHAAEFPVLRFELIRLKQRALELGVLNANDLPEIELPPPASAAP